ncbi:hypothetical protein AK812_SmicGene25456 [Symbiodinium microadriaticum]|uniref:Uncharacterized protein n=1 Tax=Symbiodinium microadriaticum TaxID=2951 RepID=A0A1Q9DBT6_SYMMI|nr:hypothetical protein AK812_SmicGene25456 [Symbiodinium microadriaticum]
MDGAPWFGSWESFNVVDAGGGKVHADAESASYGDEQENLDALLEPRHGGSTLPQQAEDPDIFMAPTGIGSPCMGRDGARDIAGSISITSLPAGAGKSSGCLDTGVGVEAETLVVDAGYGQVALHQAASNRFVKMSHNVSTQRPRKQIAWDMIRSPHRNWHQPGGWDSERFTVVDAHGHGRVALHNPWKNRDWAKSSLAIPAAVAIAVNAKIHGTDVNLDNASWDPLQMRDMDGSPHWGSWETFTAVDAGAGKATMGAWLLRGSNPVVGKAFGCGKVCTGEVESSKMSKANFSMDANLGFQCPINRYLLIYRERGLKTVPPFVGGVPQSRPLEALSTKDGSDCMKQILEGRILSCVVAKTILKCKEDFLGGKVPFVTSCTHIPCRTWPLRLKGRQKHGVTIVVLAAANAPFRRAGKVGIMQGSTTTTRVALHCAAHNKYMRTPVRIATPGTGGDEQENLDALLEPRHGGSTLPQQAEDPDIFMAPTGIGSPCMGRDGARDIAGSISITSLPAGAGKSSGCLDTGVEVEAETLVVDAGYGQVALHQAASNRFVKMSHNVSTQRPRKQIAWDMIRSPHRNWHQPGGWDSERFTVVDAHGHGRVALHNPWKNRPSPSEKERASTRRAEGKPIDPVGAIDLTGDLAALRAFTAGGRKDKIVKNGAPGDRCMTGGPRGLDKKGDTKPEPTTQGKAVKEETANTDIVVFKHKLDELYPRQRTGMVRGRDVAVIPDVKAFRVNAAVGDDFLLTK